MTSSTRNPNGPGADQDAYARHALVVAGMHRSGTSALTRVLNLRGADLPHQLMRPGSDNPAGFWESEPLAALSEEILHLQGSSWHDIAPLPDSWPPPDVVGHQKRRLAEVLRKEFEDSALFVIKDPRICRILPLLDAALRDIDAQPCYVIPIRHPIEVAASLNARDGFTLERGQLLWLRYTVEIEHWTRDATRLFTGYNELLADWRGVTERIGNAFGIRWPREADACVEEVEAFLSSSLRHHHLGDRITAEQKAASRIVTVFEAARQAAAGEPLNIEAFDDARRWLADVDRLYTPITTASEAATVQLEREKSELGSALREQRNELDRQLRATNESLARAKQESLERAADSDEQKSKLLDLKSELKQQRERWEHEREQWEHEREQWDHERKQWEHEREQRTEQVKQFEMAIAELRKSRDHHLQTVKQTKADLEQIRNAGRRREQALKLAKAEREQLGKSIAERDQQLRDVWSSTSWRITAPARSLSERLSPALRTAATLPRKMARSVFHALPLRDETRERLVRRIRGKDLPPLSTPSQRYSTHFESLGDSPKDEYRRVHREKLTAFLSGRSRLEFPQPKRPTVSVVLILYNQAELTFACLESLRECSTHDMEIILWDNASTDETHALLDRIDGAKIVRHHENLHFLRGCNNAVRFAKGDYLLFLNNDAKVFGDSIAAALRVFEEEPSVGAVGGRVILLDGLLQEAGSIVWPDGSCLGYGRGEPPDGPEYMFRRDVDYCSGAFLLTPRQLFLELSGFDESFAPAYYEETDYCMRLHDKGFRVIYEPDAVILHLEFGSSGHTQASGLMRRNQDRFREKHARALLTMHPEPGARNALRARSRDNLKGRLLFIDDQFPHCDIGQGFPRANVILRTFVDLGYDVTVYATNQQDEAWDRVYRDIPRRVECVRGSRHEHLEEFLEARAGYYQVIYVSRPHNMRALRAQMKSLPDHTGETKVVYDAEAIFSTRDLAKLELKGKHVSKKEREKAIREEVALADIADAVIAVSEREGRQFTVDCPVGVVGHALQPCASSVGFEARRGFLFVGAMVGDDNPNADSVRWFIEEVWPLVRSRLGADDVKFSVAGLNDSDSIRSYSSHDIQILGYVDDLSSLYSSARVVVVPTRYAAGIPYKAHEAAAHGVPMVTTELISEQLGWTNGNGLLAAPQRDPKLFAEHCVKLYTDRTAWETTRSQALDRVLNECSLDAVESQLTSILKRI